MQLLSIETAWIVLLVVAVVGTMNLLSRFFATGIERVDRFVATNATERLHQEYGEKIEAVRRSCEEQIAALRENYEKRIAGLESQIEILFELLSKSNMAPQVAEARKQHNERNTVDRQPPVVLGIWPQSDLDTTGERDAIYNAGFSYRALSGADVKRSSITSALRTGKITILEIGAHGDENGIMVNGANLSAGWWENVLRNKGVKVAVLLSCDSDSSVAAAMKRAGVEHVVAIDGAISDDAAVEFAQQFYQVYAASNNVEYAVAEARLALDYTDGEKVILQ